MEGLLIVGVLFIFLGLAGFTRKGVPWSARRRLKGKAGRTVGGICLLVGIGLGILAFSFASAESRSQLVITCYSVLMGAGLTWLLMREE